MGWVTWRHGDDTEQPAELAASKRPSERYNLQCGWAGVEHAPSRRNVQARRDSSTPDFRRVKCQNIVILLFEHIPTACPAIGGKGQHDGTGSANYRVTSKVPPANGETMETTIQFLVMGWAQCGKCNALFQTSDGNTGGICISDKKPHIGIRLPLFACRERLAKLPVPFKPMNESRDVNFKGDTQTIFGWLVIAGCTWYSLTVLTMFPKNNNRVRIHLNQPIAGYQDFELETQ